MKRSFHSRAFVRVDLDYEDWFEDLDAISGDLAAVGEPFRDWSILEEADEYSFYASCLLIIDFVGVQEEHRGERLSHAFARGISSIFRNEVVALVPASLSTDEAGKLFVDEPKRRGLRRHWARGGFVQLPGTEVMILPMGDR